MPSLRIAVRNVGIINIGSLYQPSPQHKPSDTVPANLSMTSNATPIKSTDTIPTDQKKFLTSTPTKSGVATNVLPVDLNMQEVYIDTRSSSESSTRASLSNWSLSETSATENADVFSVDTLIIEQYQILPDRVWECK